ncbi:MAG: peptide-methionine (S)-S-oxide reductase MsrA [Chloroflexi bacterium]|nr:peptide-methionine (S)-S-oxide reductase MsrA [Chloroflexota bacterium]
MIKSGGTSILFSKRKYEIVTPEDALPGRDSPAFAVPERHAVLGTPIQPPFPEGVQTAVFALGCFWGAERIFWQAPGVYTTAVGYAGGHTPNPTYEEACSGKTGHAEAVLVAFDRDQISYASLLKIFFEAHDPTQGMRQGNDAGTQYRSAIYYADEEQRQAAESARYMYNEALERDGYPAITTEIAPAGPFYYAEEEHQQYIHKVPNGYCGLAGTGVSCSIPTSSEVDDGLLEVAQTEEEWRRRLSPEQYPVLRQAGTERPFTGEYVNTDDDGVYRCAACGNPLFDSLKKYQTDCGWPSFTDAVSPEAVDLIEDRSHGTVRTEVRCARCDSHLGHVFDDGPSERGGQRWCINSLSLDFDQR